MADINAVVPLLPRREILFRTRGRSAWRRLTIRILGKRSFFDDERSARPMQLTVETDVEGYRNVEVVGGDLFIALGQALLVAETIVMTLRQAGDIRLLHSGDFDVETDSVFFGERIAKLRRTVSTSKRPRKASGAGKR